MMTSECRNNFSSAFTFQQFSANYSRQMCNTTNGLATNGMQAGTTAINNQIVNNNSSNAVSTANGSLAVDSIIKSTVNFSLNEDSNGGIKDATKKSARDPLSHRIIEKRRRDRMNKCLNDLSRLIPQHYIKKGRGRIEKTEIVEMAIKYINHLRDNKAGSPTFGGQLLDNSKMNSLSAFPSINLNQFKDESEQSSPSLQNSLHNSLQNSLNKQQFNESSDDYLNGFHDCSEKAIDFIATTTVLQQQMQPTKDSSFNEKLIRDLRAYLDTILIKHQQDISNSLAGKRKVAVDFSSPKSSNSTIHAMDGLQIKLELMDVEESLSRTKKQEKLSFEDEFPANLPSRNLSASSKGNPINLSTTGKCLPSASNTLKNYLTNNDSFKSRCFANADSDSNPLNPSIKSRSLTSSPNSSNLDYSTYKFKSSIREKFDAEFNSKSSKSDHLNVTNSIAMSRPRSATVGANASSLRRMNVPLELKEKLGNSTAELNTLSSLHALENKILFENRTLSGSQQLPPLASMPKSNLVKRNSPGFVLHPNQLYYIPVEIDLANLMTHFTSNATLQDDLLTNLQSIHNLTPVNASVINSAINSKSPHHPLNLHHLNHLTTSTLQNGSQNSLNQSFQDHLSYSSPSLNSLNSIHNSSSYLNNSSIKCCLNDKPSEQDSVLYPISLSVNFRFPPLSLNAILNSQKSS